MISLKRGPLSFIKRTPVRTFLLYPLITLAWEHWLTEGRLTYQFPFLLLMLWGYLQYRFCGRLRTKLGGGGPGLETLPEGLVTSGLYAFTRNPMYLGHIIFLMGLAGALRSLFAVVLGVTVAFWFHSRVLCDERKLAERFGWPYLEYKTKVKRWIPGIC